jgi:hypothetical protein
MVVGDKVMMTPTTMVDEQNRMVKEKIAGVVKWMHPKRRFYVVEFSFAGGKIRESWPMPLAANVGAISSWNKSARC